MTERSPRRFVEGLRERRDRHRARHRIIRLAVGLAGFVVLLAGLVLIPLPGPGLPILAAGLAILALEFAWAERLLGRTVERMSRAADAAERATRVPQRVLGLLGALAAAAAATIAYAWDVPLLPI